MSDRLAVFSDGRVEQVGTPAEVYESPATRLRGRLRGRLEPPRGRAGAGRRPARDAPFTGAAREDPPAAGGRRRGRPGECSLLGRSHDATYLGLFTRYRVTHRRAGRARRPRAQNRDDGLAGGQARAPRPAGARGLGPGLQPPDLDGSGVRRLRGASSPPSTAGPRLALAAPVALPAALAGRRVPRLAGSPSLVQSFFHLDGFTGQVVRRADPRHLARPRSPARTSTSRSAPSLMAAAVTLAAAVLAFPLAYYMARYASARMRAFLTLAVLMPLWSSYLVRVYFWKLILAKEGVVSWLFAQAGPSRRPRRPPGPARASAGPRSRSRPSAPSSPSSTSGCPTWSCPSRRPSSASRARCSRPRPTSAPGPLADLPPRGRCPSPCRAWWRARSSPSPSPWATSWCPGALGNSSLYLGQAVLAYQGTAGQHPPGRGLHRDPGGGDGRSIWRRPGGWGPSMRSERARRRSRLQLAAAGVRRCSCTRPSPSSFSIASPPRTPRSASRRRASPCAGSAWPGTAPTSGPPSASPCGWPPRPPASPWSWARWPPSPCTGPLLRAGGLLPAPRPAHRPARHRHRHRACARP